jgi:hypothetical protein
MSPATARRWPASSAGYSAAAATHPNRPRPMSRTRPITLSNKRIAAKEGAGCAAGSSRPACPDCCATGDSCATRRPPRAPRPPRASSARRGGVAPTPSKPHRCPDDLAARCLWPFQDITGAHVAQRRRVRPQCLTGSAKIRMFLTRTSASTLIGASFPGQDKPGWAGVGSVLRCGRWRDACSWPWTSSTPSAPRRRRRTPTWRAHRRPAVRRGRREPVLRPAPEVRPSRQAAADDRSCRPGCRSSRAVAGRCTAAPTAAVPAIGGTCSERSSALGDRPPTHYAGGHGRGAAAAQRSACPACRRRAGSGKRPRHRLPGGRQPGRLTRG